MVLRRFPNPQARPRRPAALEALSSEPKLGLTRGGDAVEWMQRSRIALIGYPGTPLLEAVTMGVPFVVLWDPDMWPVRDDGLEAHSHSSGRRCRSGTRGRPPNTSTWSPAT